MTPFLLLLFTSSVLNHHITPVLCSNLESMNLLPSGSNVSGTNYCPAPPLFSIPGEDEPISWEASTCHNGSICSSAVEICKASDENVCYGDYEYLYRILYRADVPNDFCRTFMYFSGSLVQVKDVHGLAFFEAAGSSDKYRGFAFANYTADSPGSWHTRLQEEEKWREEVKEEQGEDISPPLKLVAGSARAHCWLFYLLAFCALPSPIITFVGLLLWWCRRSSKDEPNEELGLGAMVPHRYHYREVAAATGNFAENRRIGRGGFGAVYRGVLHGSGRHVAVKVLSPESSAQGKKEFEAEVRIIGRVRHRNLVALLGWCDSQKGLLLVYELVPGGNLDKHLHGPNDRLLNWTERYAIALDLGSAILYLHTECEQCVVHGDIKPSNVMLDSSRRAKLGDFGMARLVDHGAEPRTTQVVAGTVGYIDPEFVSTRRPSTESDVYSFGVVLLEIASGRIPTGKPGHAPALLRRVRDMYDRNTILDAADRRLNGMFDREQMERVLVTGLWCAHRDPCQRPSIVEAMAALRCEGGGMPVMPELHGTTERIRDMEKQAYRDLSSDEEVSPSTRSSAATAYHTPEDSSTETED